MHEDKADGMRWDARRLFGERLAPAPPKGACGIPVHATRDDVVRITPKWGRCGNNYRDDRTNDRWHTTRHSKARHSKARHGTALVRRNYCTGLALREKRTTEQRDTL
mmetsp:Transcript_20286/g.56436  ORF Transcript_20286/g.56436 Transcript_20286/m.56436 type:complete len:107 (-) Transcript_20286:404-724(-)